jgi:hypothetical protein
MTVAAETETGTAAIIKVVTDVQGTVSGEDLRVLAWREGR